VGVGDVIGNADLLHLVGLLADVNARNPRAGLPTAEAAVAEVEAALDLAVMGFTSYLEPPPRLLGIERRIVNAPCHGPLPLLDTRLACLAFVQYTGKNRGGQGCTVIHGDRVVIG